MKPCLLQAAAGPRVDYKPTAGSESWRKLAVSGLHGEKAALSSGSAADGKFVYFVCVYVLANPASSGCANVASGVSLFTPDNKYLQPVSTKRC